MLKDITEKELRNVIKDEAVAGRVIEAIKEGRKPRRYDAEVYRSYAAIHQKDFDRFAKELGHKPITERSNKR